MINKNPTMASTYEVEGEWYFRQQPCAIFRQGHILLVVNENGALATAKMTGPTTFRIFQGIGWQSGLEAELSQDGNTINWCNSTSWQRGQTSGVTNLVENQLPTILKFVSDASWLVFDKNPAEYNYPIGYAQAVKLNDYCPSSAPREAVSFNHPNNGWHANLSEIPGAQWVWAPGINANTPNADLQSFFFSKKFNLSSIPTSATIFIAVDDFAEITINNRYVGNIGSITDIGLAIAAQHGKTFDITQYLTIGSNTITIRAQNGPSFFAGSSTPCTYSRNPAAVVFGGLIRFAKDLSMAHKKETYIINME